MYIGKTENSDLAMLVAGLLAFVAVFLLWEAVGIRRASGRARIGADKEDAVAKVLSTLPGSVYNNLVLKEGSDIDHVYLGRVFVAVETKTAKGRVDYENHQLLLNGVPANGNPVGQLYKQLRLLRKATGVMPHGVVCMTNIDRTIVIDDGKVTVCPLRELRKVIVALSDSGLDNEGLEAVRGVLDVKSTD